MSQKQTSASQRCKSPVATPDRLSVIQDATSELSCIGICLQAMSNGMLTGSEESGPNMSAVGMALEWLSGEMERRCAAIAEASS
ncbi:MULTISPECIES: hypothetical protein [Acetobacter]|uniref:Uncharacterized protein n=1 Tax=Acetobacter pasteurianus (strain NBRC 105184 / IFO 3283-01) TaxID=634452 RepID=C7JFH7_ACEP3|nr:hypothetical protein [Acetobacter pasteurianus]BAH98998.1 hypothetical protein APA01_08500 [Acetobacter pasteurianus IFO 3283-01]BAI02049.1 hypothetical protein APA03_08500 [Acetobacter pasteurianus IFO 3283-03]BAI05097.1 hypothetical protein APA07_08500 [Acetobacter pasteurianus IFO 3283-07]BAI08144.1 hypothetical protein APA22_08500 [Acetobacter pasteurianus IFO 3283-22]BAI11192.1 hypothetical protein APA26_08500 [Acetobacter pasteurianus IFO 3283-26]